MGKQIRFYQFESDVNDLMIFLDANNMHIYDIYGKTIMGIEDLKNSELFAINKEYMSGIDNVNPPIEFGMCTVINPECIKEARFYHSHFSSEYELRNIEDMTIIRDGRFYLANEYFLDSEIVRIFNSLKSYIRKKYVYSKQMCAYFSPRFIEAYRAEKVYPANGNNVFTVTDI